MTSDLESALREAREEIAIQRCHYAVSTVAWERSGKLLDRIDAALSAASGEASGDDDAGGGDNWLEALYPSSPAPSEAPNVERDGLLKLLRHAHVDRASRVAADICGALGRMIADEDELDQLHGKIQTILFVELDSARAEGIAAERERCAKIAEECTVIGSGWRSSIAAAIRNSKP